MSQRAEKLPSDCVDMLENLDDVIDLRAAYVRVQSRIEQYSASGRPVPESLRRCERDLMSELAAHSQGR